MSATNAFGSPLEGNGNGNGSIGGLQQSGPNQNAIVFGGRDPFANFGNQNHQQQAQQRGYFSAASNSLYQFRGNDGNGGASSSGGNNGYWR